ncbi:MAG: hypothetical protein MJE77_16870 [Proteobacteria bacterium]|nr:hypothetical protein [Pseudomonadota bacterium]
MLTEQDYREFVEDLTDPCPHTRAIALNSIGRKPTGDPRMIPHLERCLDDRAVTVLSLPYLFGELRWHAAEALAFELEAIGKPRTIVVDDLPEMLNTDGIAALARQHLPEHGRWAATKDPLQRLIAEYEALRDIGAMRVCKVVFEPYPDIVSIMEPRVASR